MNELEKMRYALIDGEVLNFLLWTYAIAGALFLVYAFGIFIQTYIELKMRCSLSLIFIMIGTLFLNLVGRIITGYYFHFTIVTIINTIILVILGALFLVVIFRNNKRKRNSYKNQKKNGTN